MQLALINEQIIPYADLDPAYLDRATYFGDGVYEVLRSYDGRIFALDDHLARFTHSLTEIKITSIDINSIRNKVLQAFDQAAIPNAKIYFHITRGSAPRNHACEKDLEPNFFLTVTDLPDDTYARTNGIAVCTHPDWRWKRCDIKSLNLLPNVLARIEAAKSNCEEAIFVDDTGLITEGAGSSLFAVFANTLQTAPLTANILPSVTRAYVIKAAQGLDMQIQEESLTPAQASDADELFITVTTRDIVPVIEFDSHPISKSTPGPQTKNLIQAFKAFI